ncbi:MULTISPECIES: ABC transporter permease [Microbacterium]|uniref:ABC transporter permease n=1 Tax=Microbacterium wangchenii TaxID=2541726 RepID=A0ABX5SN40_9MICO|nr:MULTISPECIES: ABC transporter permease [Microbacterium]MCK6068273.1 ABC transporter permease [Microbacterium sp. EYE_512]QBR87554.1 ABC transporter permease [Microbacterium wangchenii]TFV84365.1 ABC transporter permease [Microbacterium sp. dk485]TXK15822.1 ABC transporter permease [Microbacterium wangchenii]
MLHRILVSPVTRRVGSALLTLFGVAVAVFLMLRALPGDQITAAYGTEAAALSPEQRSALEAYYGLDQPLIVQFFTWLGAVATGNLGFSARAQQSVLEMTALALPVTLELALLAIVIALAIGIPLGMLSASRPNSLRDWVGQGVGLAGLGVPAFLLATTLLAVSAQAFGFNPNGLGFARLWEDPVRNLLQMLMPALVLGFGIAAPIMRTTRTAVLEVRGLDFVRTARAKGVPPRRLQWRHVLRNALIPIVTMTGLQFGYLLGGAVVVEQIFSLPGIGRQVLLGINQKEFAVVQSTVLVIAMLFVIVNLLTDLLYRRIDPRVRAA